MWGDLSIFGVPSLVYPSLLIGMPNCYDFLAIFMENTSKYYVWFPIFFTCLIGMNFFNVRLLFTPVWFSSKYDG